MLIHKQPIQIIWLLRPVFVGQQQGGLISGTWLYPEMKFSIDTVLSLKQIKLSQH